MSAAIAQQRADGRRMAAFCCTATEGQCASLPCARNRGADWEPGLRIGRNATGVFPQNARELPSERLDRRVDGIRRDGIRRWVFWWTASGAISGTTPPPRAAGSNGRLQVLPQLGDRRWFAGALRARAAFPGRARAATTSTSRWPVPWAHRTLIGRALKGLEAAIGVSVVDPHMGAEGWVFGEHAGRDTGPDPSARNRLYEVYLAAERDLYRPRDGAGALGPRSAPRSCRTNPPKSCGC